MSMVSYVGCEVCGFAASAADQAWGEYQHDGASVCEQCQSDYCERCPDCGAYSLSEDMEGDLCNYCAMFVEA